MTLPISLTDVTLRDGLQAELKVVSTENKIKLFSLLLDCGYSRLEITSFVHPKWIPQLSDSEAFCESLFKQNPNPKTELMAFVPNEKGLDRLLSFPIPWASAFVAASETFNKKNVNTSIAETLTELRKVVKKTHAAKRKIRIYISTVFGCPYEGKIPLESLFSTLQKVIDLGADEIALSDTIGVAVPPQTTEILKRFSAIFPVAKTALHFHNTYGLALSNIQCGYDLGIRSFDGSTGGIGGCPYAKGATGNVAIEEIAYLFSREENYKNFRAASIRKAQEFLLKDLDLSLHGHLAEIWNKGGTIYGLS